MTVKEDLRVKRTKKALSDAFLQLLSKKPFDDITINELCDVACVRRATFYKHYTDKFNFLTSYTRSLRDKFDNSIWNLGDPAPDKEYYVAYAKRIVTFINDNITAINNAMSNEMFPSVIAIIAEQNYKDTCEHLRKSVAAGMVLKASIEVTAHMCTGGVAATVFTWIKDGCPTPADELANEIGAMISALIGNSGD